MPRYMIEFSYTADAWAALVRTPADRSVGIDKLARAYGGQLVEAYYSFSDVDGVVLFDVPDHAAASGVALTALAQGHIKSYKMIPLLTTAETVQIMQASGAINYAAPGSQAQASTSTQDPGQTTTASSG
jgi:uncharacterized protein with GYD domain